LTPIYIEPKKARRFHEGLSEICGNYQPDAYDKFKAWADDYFFLSHRNETRGVGGIFFDHVKPENEGHKDALMNFCLALGEAFPKLYAQQLVENPALPTTNELEWQAMRRSRYVEFNLLFDKGTKFGIVSNGRTESIFLSMPPVAKWVYNFQPETDTREHHTLQLLTKGIDWLNYSA
jgi:coproporphyrinogen III oxidase